MFSFDFEQEDEEERRKRSKDGSSEVVGNDFDYDDEDDDDYDDEEDWSSDDFALSHEKHQQQPQVLSQSHEIIYTIGHVDFVSENQQGPQKNALKQQSQKMRWSNESSESSSSTGGQHRVGKKDFELLRVIGKGAYGKVFLVKKSTGIDTGTFYAMKVLKKASLVIHAKDAEHTRTERSILEDVRHPFLVRLFYAFQTDFKLYLILDYASGGELFTYLEKQKMFLEDTALFYMSELTLALEHLHSHGIIYRDLKPENVLLDADGHVKLTDFGLSKVALNEDEKANTVCGTVEYMAPEALANMPYDKSVDWWSLGALAYDMMTGSPPFTSNNRKKTIDLIMNKKLNLPYFLSPDAKDLLIKLLRKSPIVRLGHDSADSIKQHRFFKPISWKKLEDRQVIPPIIPVINAPDDVDNFHSLFTSLPVVDSPADTVPNDLFNGFSFVANSFINRGNIPANPRK